MIKLAVFRAAPPHKKEIYYTKKYSKKTGLSANKSRHYAFIIYSVKTRFLRKKMLPLGILSSFLQDPAYPCTFRCTQNLK